MFKKLAPIMATVLVVGGILVAPGTASAAGTQQWVWGYESGKCLTVHGAPPYENGRDVDLYTCVSPPQANQQWEAVVTADSILMVSAVGGTGLPLRCLTVRGGGVTNGTVLELWDCVFTGGPFQGNQVWSRLQSNVNGNGFSQLYNDGSGKCATVHGGGSTNNTPIDIWTCLDQGNQAWTVPVANG